MQNFSMRRDADARYSRTPQQELARAELQHRTFPNGRKEQLDACCFLLPPQSVRGADWAIGTKRFSQPFSVLFVAHPAHVQIKAQWTSAKVAPVIIEPSSGNKIA